MEAVLVPDTRALDAPARQLVGTLRREATRAGAMSPNALSRQLYDELRRLARGHRSRWSGHETVNTTALVHEAYLKLASSPDYGSGDHFLNVASRAMRQVLVSYARKRGALKRGGDRDVGLDDAPEGALLSHDAATDLIGLDEALDRFARLDPRAARVVEMKVFADMHLDEIARALDVSDATVSRDWRRARAWLRRDLSSELSVAA